MNAKEIPHGLLEEVAQHTIRVVKRQDACGAGGLGWNERIHDQLGREQQTPVVSVVVPDHEGAGTATFGPGRTLVERDGSRLEALQGLRGAC